MLLSYALLQIDSLDTLALLGDQERFSTSVEWIGKNLQFDIVSMDFAKGCNLVWSLLKKQFGKYQFSMALGSPNFKANEERSI